MSREKPGTASSGSTFNMATEEFLEEITGASGSGCDKEFDNACSSSGSIDNNNDNSSLQASRSRPLARLDRLLRRWLPGYNYLRSSCSNAESDSAIGGQQPETEAVVPPLPMLTDQQRSGGQTSLAVDSPLPARMRKDGEVVLDTGIAKSEFCMKLEKLLRAKLIVKD